MRKLFLEIWPLLLWLGTTILLVILAFKLAKLGETTFTFITGGWAVLNLFAPTLGMIYDRELKKMVEEDLKK